MYKAKNNSNIYYSFYINKSEISLDVICDCLKSYVLDVLGMNCKTKYTNKKGDNLHILYMKCVMTMLLYKI